MRTEMYVSEKPREFEAEGTRKAASPVRSRPTLDIVPGKEEEFRYLRSWLAASDRLDRLIAATEPPAEPEPMRTPPPVLSAAAQPATPQAEAPPRRQPVVTALARRAGVALRRIGEGLEAWGSGPPARETDAPYSPSL